MGSSGSYSIFSVTIFHVNSSLCKIEEIIFETPLRYETVIETLCLFKNYRNLPLSKINTIRLFHPYLYIIFETIFFINFNLVENNCVLT